MIPVPDHVELLFIVLLIVTVGVFLVGVFKAAQLAELKSASNTTLWLLVGITAWMLLLGFLSSIGFFSFEFMPPRLPFLLFAGMFAVLFLSTRPAVKKMASATPLHWPLLLQSFRIPLEVVLWQLFVHNALPVQMTFEGYNFDVLSGVFSLILGIAFYKGWLRSKLLLLAYNIVGLLLLFTIVTIAVLSMPLPIRQFTEGIPNTLVAQVPYVWLPAVFVTLAFFLHLFSIRQSLAKDRS